ncbi:response regulator transcription factor [Paenibacillus tritici]|uniref:Response regulator transcription factor n=1 Tax=Paenibacillus tritici TaxID=1873425 RepID=A0ABX2DXP5_9BACL|nr:response regulator transcription factor [Paenibacillus tritici]NQX49496.1 response regulator transcription factor [Paenibacillus tritici]
MLKVMIVDDEPWVLEGLRTMVDWEKSGFEVCAEALNAGDALRLIREHRPDMLLTDINLPVMSGLELIAAVKEVLDPPPRFVILSGYDDFNYARTALRHKVDGYLLKPVDEEEIEELLGKIRAIIQNETASRLEGRKKHNLLVHNLISRCLQGEWNEELERAAYSLLGLQPDTELQCILAAAISGTVGLNEGNTEGFPGDLGYVFQDPAGRAGLLVRSDGLSSEALEAAAVQVQRVQSEKLGVPVAVMISGRRTGLRSIQELYAQTLEVWGLKYRKEQGGIFYYNDLRTARLSPESAGGHFTRVLDEVKEGGPEQIRAAVRDAFAAMTAKRVTIDAARAEVAHLEITLCRSIAEMQGDPDTIMSAMRLEYGNLGGLADYYKLSLYVDKLCQETALYLAQLRAGNEGNTIYNVIQYVDLEFRSKLQLQDLARQFHMNSAYLGQLFRKETGRSFSDYLNEKRIEAAKGLLKRTQLKISDIAVQVGFSNTDYFIDKFKGKVGSSPSVYKNAHKNKQL